MSKHNSKESYNEDNLDFLSHLSKDTLKSKKAQKIDDICQSFNNTVMSPRTEIDVNNDNDKSQIDVGREIEIPVLVALFKLAAVSHFNLISVESS